MTHKLSEMLKNAGIALHAEFTKSKQVDNSGMHRSGDYPPGQPSRYPTGGQFGLGASGSGQSGYLGGLSAKEAAEKTTSELINSLYMEIGIGLSHRLAEKLGLSTPEAEAEAPGNISLQHYPSAANIFAPAYPPSGDLAGLQDDPPIGGYQPLLAVPQLCGAMNKGGSFQLCSVTPWTLTSGNYLRSLAIRGVSCISWHYL
uniref:Uncharacterized protein n=1 Tax=Oryza meridionalis TaxID=40149 RepID=A0A0E0CF39_9ORYZ